MTASIPAGESADVLLLGDTDWLTAAAEALEERRETAARVAPSLETALSDASALGGTRDESHDTPQGIDRYDCVVCTDDQSVGDPIDVVREATATSSTPVVVCPSAGDEATASEAIRAGAADYVPVADSCETVPDEFVERVDDVLAAARRDDAWRSRARQFDAIFDDERTATWVLDPAGTVTRLNETAAALVERDREDVVGRPLWSLSPWAEDCVQSDLRQIVETASGGRYGNAVVTSAAAPDGERVLDVSARPVERDDGGPTSIVVECVDVTGRVTAERELRDSEELHRVTLNNMTDTVLITDEDGAYTYVCPNVNFIFGYSAQEIRELGTIDDLLGEDLFDREELAARGVLKNIECTATDRTGREHTLLVNVREVSIQDGTILYSCRDITKRKQREAALATLQATAREFLYAETAREIASQVVEDAASVLDLEASAVYLFDPDANELAPVAQSPQMESGHGPLPTVHADGSDLASCSFVEDERLFFDDVRTADRLQNRTTALRSAAFVPLGNHGVLVVGSEQVGAFDEMTREIADLLAATAEAALDRVERESRLREQERELQHRNDELAALDRINDTIREIDQALVQAETRSEIEHTVCDRLTADDRFRFAWVGAVDPAGRTVEPRATAGEQQTYLDQVDVEVAASGVEPTGRTAATREPATVTTVARRLRDESWRKHALSRDFLSVASVPLEYRDGSYGVLSVYADSRDAFDDRVRAVLAELGETIAAAISAVERKNALLTASVTRVEFAADGGRSAANDGDFAANDGDSTTYDGNFTADDDFALSRLAREADCTLSYRGGVRQTDDGSYVFVTVDEGAEEDVLRAAGDTPGITGCRQIGSDDAGGVVRLELSEPFLALELADHGAVLRRVTATPDETTLAVDVPENVAVQRVADVVEESLRGVSLRAKRSIDRSAGVDVPSQLLDRITDRQREVLETAYYSGYFESPRACTGEDVADALDISPAAFYSHVRSVEGTLFAAVFEGAEGQSAASPIDEGVQ